MQRFKLFALTILFSSLLQNISYATTPNYNVECRVYDPNKRCVWVLKSSPYPVPYVSPKKRNTHPYRSRAKNLPNPVMSPLPILSELKAQQASEQNISSTPRIVMDTITGISPSLSHAENKKSEIQPVITPATKQLTKALELKLLNGHVEITEVLPVKIEPIKLTQKPPIPIQPKPVEIPDKLKPHFSWVSITSDNVYAQLAAELTEFIHQQKPNPETILRLEPALQKNSLTPLLLQQLQDQGYQLASEKAQLLNTATIRYIIDESQGGILLQIQVDSVDAARWFVLDHSKTNLIAASAFTVRGNHHGK